MIRFIHRFQDGTFVIVDVITVAGLGIELQHSGCIAPGNQEEYKWWIENVVQPAAIGHMFGATEVFAIPLP